MIRITLLFAFVLGLAIYAWKDWYKSLCGLILLMAVIEHPDMPKTMFGVQGLNPWNFLLLSVFLGWATSRRREGLRWDMPRHVNVLLLLYLGVVLWGFARMMADRGPLEVETTAYLVSEYLINSIKWVVPGLLLFDGCRSRGRFNLALFCVLAMYVLLALQVIKWMPLSTVTTGGELAARSGKILVKEVGYHRVNLSMLLGGATWAIFAARVLAPTRAGRLAVVLVSLVVLYGQALTAGRTGYATWGLIGLLLGLLRWRAQLLLAPALALGLALLVPGTVDRMLQGFTEETRDWTAPAIDQTDIDGPDQYTITAGRTLIWPYVIDKIDESPFLGYGRQAMRRTGLAGHLMEELGESFPHPHNAYLEMLLDNGWLGMAVVMPFYLIVLGRGVRLFRDRRSPLFEAIGGVACALVLALLVAAIGSHTFYPREGAVGMWCAIGLLLRVGVERANALAEIRRQREEEWRERKRRRQASPPSLPPPDVDRLLWPAAS